MRPRARARGNGQHQPATRGGDCIFNEAAGTCPRKSYPLRGLRARGIFSSMRPRARARGNGRLLRFRRRARRFFNEAAGTCPRKWQDRLPLPQGLHHSSMRPRARARGNALDAHDRTGRPASSMRPRARARGNASTMAIGAGSWAIFNEAAGTCPRKSSAPTMVKDIL